MRYLMDTTTAFRLTALVSSSNVISSAFHYDHYSAGGCIPKVNIAVKEIKLLNVRMMEEIIKSD